MVVIACLLLPVMGVLLYGMDRVENWLTRPARPPRHAGARPLRLLQGGRREPSVRRAPSVLREPSVRRVPVTGRVPGAGEEHRRAA
ncbi:hypothetical protein ACH4L5_32680 [Streptomyces sp. NPDC017405]|uniref:hypothetical protein n=1 Tax=unclassified Streptomyces TaxID=2593676 RepID=UPI003795334B